MEDQKMIDFGVFRQPQQICSIWKMTLSPTDRSKYALAIEDYRNNGFRFNNWKKY